MKPFQVVKNTSIAGTKWRIEGPGIDPDKWAYSAPGNAVAMCNVFNSIAAALTKPGAKS